jgi:hypothetical protein
LAWMEETSHRGAKGSDAAREGGANHRCRKSGILPTNSYHRKAKNLRRGVFFIFTS